MSNSTNTSNTTNNVANKPPTKPLPAIPVKQPVNSANGATNTQSSFPSNGTTPVYNSNNPIPNPQMHKTPTGVTYTTPSSFQLPENENITKLELGRLWSQSKGGASNPSILFIDLRPKDQFEQSTIKGSNIVNIDLTAIKPHISARELEMYLNSRNLKMGHLFSSRHTFDCIVMYDQDSEYIQASSILNGQVSQCTIYDIKLAITEHEYSKKLRKAPYFLIGGLKEWYSYLGDKGLIHHTQNKFPSISITSSNSSSVKSSSQLSATGAIGPARGKPIYQNVSDFLSGQASAIKAQESMMKPRSPQPARLRSPIFEPIPISTTSSNQSSERRRTIFDDHYYNFTGSPPVPEPAKLSHISPPMTPTQSTSQSSYFTTITPPLTPMPVSSAPSSHIGATGLRNLGNTCFMNSIIQCINGTSPLARHFLDGSYRKQINTVNYMGYKGVLAEEFASLIRSLWNNQSNAISPSSFRVSSYFSCI
jgi:ubiquitin carboxyl-terminal hydrolase 8